MRNLDPAFHQGSKLVCPFDKLQSFSIGGKARMIVVDLIALLAAGVEAIDEGLVGRAEDKSSRLEGRRVVAALG